MTGDEAVRDGVRAGERAARRLAELGVCMLEPGLSDAEFDRIETEYGIAFAADHRGFLAAGLPVGRAAPPEEGESPRNPWPNWRDGHPELHAHRYPASRAEASRGRPVLSVAGADTIHYGRDLVDWVEREFGDPDPEKGWPEPAAAARVPFWSDLAG
ncbi:hypothetical protein [Streptomyces sp. EN27]|uniref:hypothetical protein n=1 Tax=Streptomyces sp. EN27 TaxID=211464 RepID=UPI000851EF2B|nr:hypothetical protein [Streptomyces sp. EN27]